MLRVTAINELAFERKYIIAQNQELFYISYQNRTFRVSKRRVPDLTYIGDHMLLSCFDLGPIGHIRKLRIGLRKMSKYYIYSEFNISYWCS